MQLKTIQTFLVHPDKNKEEKSEITATNYTIRVGKLFELLKKIFDDAPNECEYDVKFVSSDQSNVARDSIVAYLKTRTIDNGRKIADLLQNVTRSGSGIALLFLIFGEDAKGRMRLVISRFPAEAGILAHSEEGRLQLSLREDVFMKNAKAYKAANFEGTNTSEDFWTGQVVDMQINYAFREVADYWIKDFLQSEFVMTGMRGTVRFGTAIKDVMNSTDNFEVKKEIASAVNLSKKLDTQVLSARKLIEKLNLSDEAQELILQQYPGNTADKSFKFSIDVLKSVVPFKTVYLDNGALVTAPLDKFNKVFKVTQLDKGEMGYYTEGKIIDERIKKTS